MNLFIIQWKSELYILVLIRKTANKNWRCFRCLLSKIKKVATYIIAPELLISVPCRDVVFRNNCTKIKQVLSCCWIDCWIYLSLVLTIILLILRVKCCELDYMLYTLFCTCFKSEVNEEKKETVAIFFFRFIWFVEKIGFCIGFYFILFFLNFIVFSTLFIHKHILSE